MLDRGSWTTKFGSVQWAFLLFIIYKFCPNWALVRQVAYLIFETDAGDPLCPISYRKNPSWTLGTTQRTWGLTDGWTRHLSLDGQTDGVDRLLYGRLGRGRGGDQATHTFPYTGLTDVLRISVLKFHVQSLGVQRCTTYRKYRETAVQDTSLDTKNLIKILILTIYHTLLYFNIW